jgi:beta-lactamase class A
MGTRRDFIQGSAALAGCGFFGATRPTRAAASLDSLGSEFARIERDIAGRLGVAVLDTASGQRAGHHSDDKFPMCSTFKLLGAGAALKRVDDGQEHLDRRIMFAAKDVVANSPITEKHVADGMTLAELCEAAITLSDNTAGNMILASLDGPAGLTAFARSLGDTVTRLDRWETELNEAIPGDPRDTTTPSAMLNNVNALVLGSALSAASREQLTKWLLGNKTGDTRMRAKLATGWRVADKTGSGERGSTNDIGVIWPPERAPVIVTIYLTETTASAEQRNATLAAVCKAVAAALGS